MTARDERAHVVTNCRSCGAPIRWAKTTNGEAIPLDPAPVTGGNIELCDGVAHVFTPGQIALFQRERFVSHFVTCPHAAQWRRKA